MTRRLRLRLRLACALLISLSLTGCVGWDWVARDTHASTPLVKFLYGDDAVPPQDASVQLRLPIRVGLSFLPSENRTSGAMPTAAQRAEVLQAIREKFRGLPYVTEIVIVPDYYLDPRHGGMAQLQQLARLHHLDLYALASYDIVSANEMNAGALAYLTIVGQFFVPGDTQTTQTLLDLAVIEPQGRQLVLRAGGTSQVKNLTSMADMDRTRSLQIEKGLHLAREQLVANFAAELGDFENRVRAGTAPLTVARQGGGGSVDLALLAALAGCLALLRWRGVPAWRRT